MPSLPAVVEAVHERTSLGVRRAAEHGRRGAGLDGASTLEVDHLVRDCAGEVEVVRDHHQRLPEVVEGAQQRRHLAHEARVECRRGFVEQHDGGLHRERARDRDALLLPARQLRRMVMLLARQPHAREVVPPHLLGLRPREFLDGERRLDDVAERRQVRKQVEVLEDNPDACADTVHERVLVGRRQCPAWRAEHLDVVDRDRPGVERLEPVQAPQHRRLAAARRAEDRGELRLGDRKRGAIEDRVGSIPFDDVRDLDHARGS
jgi:hypothetical protein